MRRPWVIILLPLLVCQLGACAKARGDDFSRHQATEALLGEGAEPRHSLRYRPLPGRDLVYQLHATRRTEGSGPRARMRLRVALTFPAEGQSTTFALRLLTLLQLEPEPPAGAPDLGPTHLLLHGSLGPRGTLDRLEEGHELPSPVNLTLLAPLVFPLYPESKVGVGGSWQSSRRFSWSHELAPDRLIGRMAGFEGRSETLLERRYTWSREDKQDDTILARLEGKAEARLRSSTRTLSHFTRHEGSAKATMAIAVDRSTGLPETAKISLTGSYDLEASGAKRKVQETLELTLTRER